MEDTIQNEIISNDVVYMKQEDIQKGYDENDLNIVNGVLAGKIKVEQQQPVVNTPELPAEPITEETVIDTETLVAQRLAEEQERFRAYYEDLENKKKQENELAIAEKAAILKQLEEEKKKREEYENRIRELSNQKPTENTPLIEEDDELVSDYAKNTRKMIDDIKTQLDSSSKLDPKYKELEERLQKFEQIEADRIKAEQEKERQRKAREAEEKVLNSIRDFQSKYPELQTKKDFEVVATEFDKFKNSLVTYTKATSPKDIDRIMMTYFDENKGRKLREETEKIGIKPPEEYDKFVQIAELIDMTRGIEYDPVLERFVEVKNQFGDPVRYRSIEESYKVKNHYKEISEAKKSVARQVSNKLNTIQQSPVTIANSETSSFESGLTKEQAGQIIRDAELYIKDRNKYKLLERAYAMIGAAPPAYRGK